MFCLLLRGRTVTLRQSCIHTEACRYTLTHTVTHGGDPVIALVMDGSFTVALITQRSISQHPLCFLLLPIVYSSTCVSSLHPNTHSSLCLFQSNVLFHLYTCTCSSRLLFGLCCFFFLFTLFAAFINRAHNKELRTKTISAWREKEHKQYIFHLDGHMQIKKPSPAVSFTLLIHPCFPLSFLSLLLCATWCRDSWSVHCIYIHIRREITTNCEPNAGKFARCGLYSCWKLASLYFIGLFF